MFGLLNGVNVTVEPTDWKPSPATAMSGPSSRPQGCSRLRAGTTTFPGSIVVDPGSLPSRAIWSHVTWRNPPPCSPATVPLSAPPAACSKPPSV